MKPAGEEMKVTVAAALAVASLQVASANITYRTCKLPNGVSILHDGNCDELRGLHRAKPDDERLNVDRKEAEEAKLKRVAEQERLRQIERERQDSHNALKDCVRFARCRINQYKYHLARVTDQDLERIFGEPVLTHTLRHSIYNYYRVNADGRRVVLQVEMVGSNVASVNTIW
jgi:hypothetical protein